MADNKQPERKGGLGRGLAALIPPGPSAGNGGSPRLGNGAADVLLGGGNDGAKKAAGEGSAQKGAQQGAQKPAQKPVQKSAKKNATASVPGAPKMSDIPSSDAPLPPALAAHQQGNDFGATYREIPIGLIQPNAQQPRTVFDEDELAELVHSIREFGLLQPIVVREIGPESFELIMGERRWRAASKAGLRTIPAIVRATEDAAMLRDALLENIHRVQLNPLEEAAAYQQLLEEFGVTHAELADKLGRSRPVITNMIRLLSLPVAVQRRVAAGVLSAGHARALLGVKLQDEQQRLDAQDALADRVVAEGLSVRATEEAVTLINRGEQNASPRKKTPPAAVPEVFSDAANRLADVWDTKVTVSVGKRKGKMVIEFGDQEDFERIMDLIERR